MRIEKKPHKNVNECILFLILFRILEFAGVKVYQDTVKTALKK